MVCLPVTVSIAVRKVKREISEVRIVARSVE